MSRVTQLAALLRKHGVQVLEVVESDHDQEDESIKVSPTARVNVGPGYVCVVHTLPNGNMWFSGHCKTISQLLGAIAAPQVAPAQ